MRTRSVQLSRAPDMAARRSMRYSLPSDSTVMLPSAAELFQLSARSRSAAPSSPRRAGRPYSTKRKKPIIELLPDSLTPSIRLTPGSRSALKSSRGPNSLISTCFIINLSLPRQEKVCRQAREALSEVLTRQCGVPPGFRSASWAGECGKAHRGRSYPRQAPRRP